MKLLNRDRIRECLIPTIACVAIVASDGAVGCANVSHMVLYQNTNLGLKGSVSPSTGNTSIKVGFERDFLTILPKVKIVECPLRRDAWMFPEAQNCRQGRIVHSIQQSRSGEFESIVDRYCHRATWSRGVSLYDLTE